MSQLFDFLRGMHKQVVSKVPTRITLLRGRITRLITELSSWSLGVTFRPHYA